eukprot:6075176-Pyramimonas_sp.AAC.1
MHLESEGGAHRSADRGRVEKGAGHGREGVARGASRSRQAAHHRLVGGSAEGGEARPRRWSGSH